MNEYANSEAVMYAVRQAENESVKRRKMLAVNQADASVFIIHFDTMIHGFAGLEVFVFDQKAYGGRLDEG